MDFLPHCLRLCACCQERGRPRQEDCHRPAFHVRQHPEAGPPPRLGHMGDISRRGMSVTCVMGPISCLLFAGKLGQRRQTPLTCCPSQAPCMPGRFGRIGGGVHIDHYPPPSNWIFKLNLTNPRTLLAALSLFLLLLLTLLLTTPDAWHCVYSRKASFRNTKETQSQPRQRSYDCH